MHVEGIVQYKDLISTPKCAAYIAAASKAGSSLRLLCRDDLRAASCSCSREDSRQPYLCLGSCF